MVAATAAIRLLSGDREPCRCATTADIALQGLPVIDGVQTEAGDRILVRNQTDKRLNGIYTVNAGKWRRASDADHPRAINLGVTVNVQEGIANGGTVYRFGTKNPKLGIDPIDVNFYLSASFTEDVQELIEDIGGELITFERIDKKNQPNGYAGVDATTKLPLTLMPSGVERTALKNQPNGYPGLNGSGVVPRALLDLPPPVDTSKVINDAGTGAANSHGFKNGISMTRSSAPGEVGTGGKFSYHFLFVSSDTASQQTGVAGATSTKVDGLQVTHNFGGPGTRGGRHAGDFTLFQNGGATEADNPDRFYVGVVGQVISKTGDGGTLSAPKGAYFGMNPYAGLIDEAYFTANHTGLEVNTYIQEATNGRRRTDYHSGLQIASFIGQQGAGIDAAISISNMGGPNGWRHGILFSTANGSHAFDATSTVMGIRDAVTMLAGIDFRGVNFTVAPYLANNLLLGGGKLEMRGAGARIEIGSITSASSPIIDLHSSGTNNLFDVRIYASEGTVTNGEGRLNISAKALDLVSSGGIIRIGGNRVVGPRVTGWVSMTGAGDSTTAFSTSTVTLQQLAQRVRSLEAALLSNHGLIGA